MNTGKAQDEARTVPEMIKAPSFDACEDIWRSFKEMFDEGEEQPGSWENTPLSGLQNDNRIESLKRFRWISKLNHMRQWYNRSWRHIYRMSRPAPQVRTYGFAKGNSANDLAAIIAEVFRKTAGWGEPIMVASLDVLTAFDRMKHGPLEEANEFMEVPVEARLAAMRDYEGKTAQFKIPGAGTSAVFPLEQSGGQGGVRTPDEFNNMMRCILIELIIIWEELGIGYSYKGGMDNNHMLNHLLWADNIFVLGTSTEEVQYMLDMITGSYR